MCQNIKCETHAVDMHLHKTEMPLLVGPLGTQEKPSVIELIQQNRREKKLFFLHGIIST